jgi:hypothetical protein
MSQNRKPADPGQSWLEKRLASLDALYHRFGRDGLKDQPATEVGLLLTAKQLQLRDAAGGHAPSDDQKAVNRRLELEIKDLAAYVKGLTGSISLSELRAYRPPKRTQQRDQPHAQGGRDGPER